MELYLLETSILAWCDQQKHTFMQYTMLVCDSPKKTTGTEHVRNAYNYILMLSNVRIVEFWARLQQIVGNIQCIARLW